VDAEFDLERARMTHPAVGCQLGRTALIVLQVPEIPLHSTHELREPALLRLRNEALLHQLPDSRPIPAPTRGEGTDEAPSAPAEASSQPAPATAPRERKIREGTKQALVLEMLRRPEGASIAEIAEATGWLSHTARGVLAGSLKKKLGLAIESSKDDERGRIYRLG
jgi:hypothetical protein